MKTFRDILALLFASLLPLTMAWLGFIVLANEADRGQSLLAAIYSVGKILQFGFPISYVWLFAAERLRTMSFARKGVLLGIGFGLLVDLAMGILYFAVLRDSPLIADTPAKIFGKLEEFRLATPVGYLAIGLFLCVVHSLLEEYYWRWFVFGWLSRLMPLAGAIVLSSVAFMAHHVVILYVYFPDRFWLLGAPLALGVAIGGAVWAWIYQRSGSLLGPWLSHILIDAGILLIGYDLLRGMW
jgi:membrane protease YdiL (CAAX protease family)